MPVAVRLWPHHLDIVLTFSSSTRYTITTVVRPAAAWLRIDTEADHETDPLFHWLAAR
jgi:hypothetical protein